MKSAIDPHIHHHIVTVVIIASRGLTTGS